MENVDQRIIDYAKTCKNGEMTTEGFKASIDTMSLSAKAGKVALGVLATAGNMLAMWAISKGIELAVNWIDKLVHSAEYADKAIKAATDNAKSSSGSIKDIQKETVDMEKSIDSIIDRYAKLSQGVNAFTNENMSLPTDQYEEFLDLNEQLAGLFPSLARNYDENGNAILGLSGPVDSVTGSIRSLIEQEKELARTQIRENLEKYFNGTDEAEGAWKALEEKKQNLEEANEELAKLKNTYEGLINADSSTVIGRYHKNFAGKEQAKYIEYIKNNFGEDTAQAMEDAVSVHLGKGLNGQFADLVVDFSSLELNEKQKKQIAGSYGTFYSKLLAKQKTAMSEFESQNSEFSNNAVLWLEDLSFYKNSNKYVQTVIQNLVRNTDWSNYDFEELDYDGVKRILQDSVLTPFQIAYEDPATKKSLDDALKGLFTMDTADMPVDDIATQTNEYINSIAAAIHKDPEELKIKLGFDYVNDLEEQYQNAIDFAKDKFDGYDPTAFFKEHSINTQEEIDAWQKIAQGAGNAAETVKKYIQDSKNPIPLSDQLTTSQESLGKFQSTIKSAYDAYSALLSGNCSSTELLDSIQAINQAASDMGSKMNWELIGDTNTSAQELGDVIDYISGKYAKSVLSGAGIDADSKFGQMLANMVKESYKAEAEFKSMNAQIDRLQSSYQTLSGILGSYNATGHISLDSLQSLLNADENMIAMLEVENGRLAINQEAYENLAAAQMMELKAKLNAAAAAEIESLAKGKAKEATNKNADASNNAVEKLDRETSALRRNTIAVCSYTLAKAKEGGVTEEEIQGVLDKYNEIWNTAVDSFDGDFHSFVSGAGSAKNAASEAKDAAEELGSGLDSLQSAYGTLKDATDEYNKNGHISMETARKLCEVDFRYAAMLDGENGRLSVNAQKFREVTAAKLGEMKTSLARKALDVIKSLATEAEATEYLASANRDLAGSLGGVTEAGLEAAYQSALAKGGRIAEAAEAAMAGYRNMASIDQLIRFSVKQDIEGFFHTGAGKVFQTALN